MSDLISRRAAMNSLSKVFGIPLDYDGNCDEVCDEAFAAIDALPSIDAVPVVREHWIDACRGKACICSRCGEEFDHTCNAIKDEWLFCPKCGAKMDEEEKPDAD